MYGYVQSIDWERLDSWVGRLSTMVEYRMLDSVSI